MKVITLAYVTLRLIGFLGVFDESHVELLETRLTCVSAKSIAQDEYAGVELSDSDLSEAAPDPPRRQWAKKGIRAAGVATILALLASYEAGHRGSFLRAVETKSQTVAGVPVPVPHGMPFKPLADQGAESEEQSDESRGVAIVPQHSLEYSLQRKFIPFLGSMLGTLGRTLMAPLASAGITGTMKTVGGWLSGAAGRGVCSVLGRVGSHVMGNAVAGAAKSSAMGWGKAIAGGAVGYLGAQAVGNMMSPAPAPAPGVGVPQYQYPPVQYQMQPLPLYGGNPAQAYVQPGGMYPSQRRLDGEPGSSPEDSQQRRLYGEPDVFYEDPILIPEHMSKAFMEHGKEQQADDDDDDSALPDSVTNRQSIFDTFTGLSSSFDDFWPYMKDIFCNVSPHYAPQTVHVWEAASRKPKLLKTGDLPPGFGCKDLARFAKKAVQLLQKHEGHVKRKETHKYLNHEDIKDLFRVIQHMMTASYLMTSATHASHGKVTLDHSSGRSQDFVAHVKHPSDPTRVHKNLVAIGTPHNQHHDDFAKREGNFVMAELTSKEQQKSPSEVCRDAIGHDEKDGHLNFPTISTDAHEHRNHFLANAKLVHELGIRLRSRGNIHLHETAEDFPGAVECYKRGKEKC